MLSHTYIQHTALSTASLTTLLYGALTSLTTLVL